MENNDIRRVSNSSTDVQGNNAATSTVAISANGRYVVFSSSASNLVENDTNGVVDIFVRDMQTGTVQRVTTNAAGVEANGTSTFNSHAISADGRFIAFSSFASNLVAGDTNDAREVFVKDMQTGAVLRVATDAAGNQFTSNQESPAASASYANISADGKHVVFASNATTLVANDSNGQRDLFIKHLLTGAIERVNTSATGVQAVDGILLLDTGAPTLSGDGRYVVFESTDATLVAGDRNASPDVFLKDTQTGAIQIISSNGKGEQGNTNSWAATITADGSKVVFISSASNLVSGDTNGRYDVFMKNLSDGNIIRVNTDSAGNQMVGNYSLTEAASISNDGKYVVFNSSSNALVPGDNNTQTDTFIKNTETGAIQRANLDNLGLEANSGHIGADAVISGDGRYVSFQSSASNLVENDTNNFRDIFRVANTFSNPDTPYDANVDVLSGSTGGDKLAGGIGNDTYLVNHIIDVITESIDAGLDTVKSTLSYALPDNVENLVSTG